MSEITPSTGGTVAATSGVLDDLQRFEGVVHTVLEVVDASDP